MLLLETELAVGGPKMLEPLPSNPGMPEERKTEDTSKKSMT